MKQFLIGGVLMALAAPAVHLMAHEHHGHSHSKTRAVPADAPRPSLSVTAQPQSADRSTWLITIAPKNFRFIPLTQNIPSSVQEGHAHVYLNGQKLGRTHTTTYELQSIPKGTHQVRVVLSTNGHEEITVQGQPVSGTVTITR